MKKYQKIIGILFLSFQLVACSTDIFGPNKGTLEGVVKDNNGNELAGVTVTAKYISSTDADGTVNYSSINTVTDQSGYHFLDDVFLTENKIIFQKEGFKTYTAYVNLTQNNNHQNINTMLVGSPKITQLQVDNTTISVAANQTATFTVTVKDFYNDDTTATDFKVTLLLYKSGDLISSLTLDLTANSNTVFVFKKKINATDISLGTYTLASEVIDPDGNFYRKEFQQILTVNN